MPWHLERKIETADRYLTTMEISLETVVQSVVLFIQHYEVENKPVV